MNTSRMALIHLAQARRKHRGTLPGRRVRSRDSTPRWTAPAATYIICTTPRSGSWLLSDGLAQTGVAGRPREWFNTVEEQQHYARWRMIHDSDMGFHRYLELARAESTSKNGFSGVKLHYYQFAELPQKCAAIVGLRSLAPGQLLTRIFPNAKYIWLTRRDKVRQAISFLVANNTDVWWSFDAEAPRSRLEAGREPSFDAAEIQRMERVFTRSDASWRSFFATYQIAPHVVQYDDLAADCAGTIRAVLHWLGVPQAESIVVPPPRLKRQAGARNEEWAERYEAAKADSPTGRQSAAEALVDPQRLRIRRPFSTLPDAWKQWIMESKRREMPNEEIMAVLMRHGYSGDAVSAALGKTETEQATSA